jgi:hypothetical protein
MTEESTNLRQTSASRRADRERGERAKRRDQLKHDPVAATVAASSAPSKGSAKRGTFFEEEPLTLDVEARPGAKRAARVLPATERDVVRATVISNRAALIPTGPLSAMALGAARAEFDFKVDAKRRQRIYFFDRVLKRGALNWENLLALLKVKGVPVEIEPNAAHLVARYRDHLTRQMTPLARSVWRDEGKDYTPIAEFE